MMKSKRFLGLLAASAVVTQFSLIAAELGTGKDWLDVSNRVRFEYDDNVYERSTDTTDSFKIIEEIQLGITLDREPTFLTLRYRPSFTWWENREPDDTDLHHDLDVVLNHRFSPRVSLGIKNTLRLAEQPEEMDRGIKIRENDDYTYNVTDGNLDVRVLPRTHLLIGGRFTILNYDESDVAETEDYEIFAVGVTLRQNISSLTHLLAEYRREEISYNLGDRGSDSDFIGLGVEHTLGASFVATVRGGMQSKAFNDASIGDQDEPYGDLTLTYLFSPRTRLSLGGGYSMFEADVYPYTSQDRTIMFVSVARDLTAKLSLYLAASYQSSDYSADRAIDDLGVPASGGEEEVTQGSLRLAYQVNARNSVEFNYQYIDLTSDLREEFDRNRVSIGWRLDI